MNVLKEGDLSDSSETDEDRKAILEALPEAVATWRQRCSAVEISIGQKQGADHVLSIQQKNAQAAFKGANDGLRRLVEDATEGGVKQGELLSVTGLSQQEMARIREGG